ncbi:MAG: cytochrome c3 family protein [Myxococcales bacterium]|nr:cytochrome c3 family protein [Myxococcales bacterium]
MKRLLALGLAFATSLAFGAWCDAKLDAQGRGRALRSRVVYPPQRIALRMDHAHPAHRALRCEQCHEGASASDSSRDLLLPREATCNPCHAEQTDRTHASEETCGTCHVGEATPNGFAVAPSSFPPPRVRFSHATHARDAIRCLDCHEGVTRSALATTSHLPTMESCFRCHGGDGLGRHAQGAPTTCDTCHLTRSDGRLRTSFPEGELVPPAWLHGMLHDRDFLVRHRWVAADASEACASCHAERECADCHDGRTRPQSVHPNDYLTTHPTEALRGTPRCESCHTTQRFCTECHARLGLSTMSSPGAVSGAPFHPPGFARAHGDDARRSLTTCASCHSERDCVTCHGATGAGAISPHPPSFVTRCREAFDRNPRACVTCHGPDASAVASRCL